MLNVKAGDRIAMSGYTESYGQGFQYCHAEIVCHSCGTRFNLQGKCKQDVIDLWNNGKIPKVCSKVQYDVCYNGIVEWCGKQNRTAPFLLRNMGNILTLHCHSWC